MATATKVRVTPKYQSVIKVSVPLPPEVHRALAIASVETTMSQTKLIQALVQEHFRSSPKADLALLSPGDANGWKRVSVFLPATLKERAAHEVQRQHGSSEDKRYSGSLASAIAALVQARFLPDYKN